MKKINYSIFLFLIFVSISCIKDEEQLPVVDSASISLNFTDLDDESGQYQNVFIEAESKIRFQRASFELNEDSVFYKKGINFTLEGDGIYSPKYINIQLTKKEAKTNLEYNFFYGIWNYRSLQDEHDLFFKAYDQATIDLGINSKYASIVVGELSDNFRIKRLYKVMVNGKEEWAIEAEFKGLAERIFYYYNSESKKAIFEVTNGVIKGVLF